MSRLYGNPCCHNYSKTYNVTIIWNAYIITIILKPMLSRLFWNMMSRLFPNKHVYEYLKTPVVTIILKRICCHDYQKTIVVTFLKRMSRLSKNACCYEYLKTPVVSIILKRLLCCCDYVFKKHVVMIIFKPMFLQWSKNACGLEPHVTIIKKVCC